MAKCNQLTSLRFEGFKDSPKSSHFYGAP